MYLNVNFSKCKIMIVEDGNLNLYKNIQPLLHHLVKRYSQNSGNLYWKH